MPENAIVINGVIYQAVEVGEDNPFVCDLCAMPDIKACRVREVIPCRIFDAILGKECYFKKLNAGES